MRSAVSMLSLISTGTPCNGPRGPFALRSRSSASAIDNASGLSSITEFTFGPLLSSASIRARYHSATARAVNFRAANPCSRSASVASSKSKDCAEATRAAGRSRSDLYRKSRRSMSAIIARRVRERTDRPINGHKVGGGYTPASPDRGSRIAQLLRMFRDFRYAFRVLSSRPAFTLVAALSLALGIGANSAIFGLIDGLWFRPLAVPKSGEIVRVFGVTDQDNQDRLSYPEYLDFKQQATQLREVVAIGGRGATLVQGNNHQLLDLNLVSSNFFTALGVTPLYGRFFTPQDEADTTRPLSVVLGNYCWHRYFGADPNIVGKQIRIQRINDVLVTVMGVLPASFRGIENGGDRDLWFSRQAWNVIGQPEELETRGNRWFFVMGRMAPGATEKSANTQIETIARRMADAFPATNKNRRAALISDFHFRMKQGGKNGVTLLAIVLLVVMISSVNVANLLLSRAGVRGKEMAVRLALGAGRWRLMQQLMAENILLGLLGLAGGIAVGAWLIEILPALMVQPPGFHDTLDRSEEH